MNDEKLVSIINRALKAPWTKTQIANGKRIKVEWSWAKSINSVVKKYRSRGWDVDKQLETDGGERRLFLIFVNKRWSKSKKR